MSKLSQWLRILFITALAAAYVAPSSVAFAAEGDDGQKQSEEAEPECD